MNTKEIKEYKKILKLSQRQRDMLVGLLLGDGHLETQNRGKTFRLKVEHSLEQSEYLEWIFQGYKEWIRAEQPYCKKRTDGRESVGFTTYSHGAFRFYAQQFYKEGKKIMPRMIQKLLTPIGLAIWFMDDGSWKSMRHKTYILHTLGYTKQDLEIVQKALFSKFGIVTALHKQKEKYLRIYVVSKSAKDFERIVRPYVSEIPSMKYKLGNTHA